MKIRLFYLKLELKRALKCLPLMAAGAAVLMFFMGAAALLAGKALYGGPAAGRITVGAVLPENDALAKQVTSMRFFLYEPGGMSGGHGKRNAPGRSSGAGGLCPGHHERGQHAGSRTPSGERRSGEPDLQGAGRCGRTDPERRPGRHLRRRRASGPFPSFGGPGAAGTGSEPHLPGIQPPPGRAVPEDRGKRLGRCKAGGLLRRKPFPPPAFFFPKSRCCADSSPWPVSVPFLW